MDKLSGEAVLVMGAYFALLLQSALATIYTVGGSSGWIIPVSDTQLYTNWSYGRTFKVGDVLVFNFQTGQHDVVEVTKANYESCGDTSPVRSYKTGPANITLNTTGAHYFICSFGSDCQGGQKIEITVAAYSSSNLTASSPSSQSPPTSAPSNSPEALTALSGSPTSAPSNAPNSSPDESEGLIFVGFLGLMVIITLVFLVANGNTETTSASKVEKFLNDCTHAMPTRYSYSQLKKITNNLADKLGEGGFGVVYKGKLSNGNLVAVKILDQSRHSESQFMNEVATVGRIHHVHLVRLLGYCFEGFRSALVYEYMANGSLEKFLFEKNEKPHILSGEQLYSIALGAARGIAYLHEECDRRIIHFDIKPHNILLDADFTPKVSDFGLAKLCGRLDDHISITATRGTPGYIAPELWSRNLGPITDKADVYSFGMLLLEIVGRRKNIDALVSRLSEVYFPEWVFNLLKKGELEERLRGRGPTRVEIESENDMQMMRMSKIGLWCIQYNSMDRPLMSRVVQMLEGNGDEVSDPPFPFNTSASPQVPLMSSNEESSFNSSASPELPLMSRIEESSSI